MDKAIVGEARAGYAKAGVQNFSWTKMLAQFENVSVQVDLRAGYAKADVKRNEWAKTLATFETVSAPNEITVGGSAQLVIGGKQIRVGVLTDHFTDLIKAMEKIS